MVFEGIEYELVLASDLERDGMMLEVCDVSAQPKEQVLEVFYSDVSGAMTLTTFDHSVPLGLVEIIMAEARKRLPLVNGPKGHSSDPSA
jgi:hypothetical protein